MTRILLRSRRLMLAGVWVLMAGVMVLSAATRQPCIRVSTAPWRLLKVGHMTKAEGLDTVKLRVAAAAQVLQATPIPHPLLSPEFCLRTENLPPAYSAVVQTRHLRAPPRLG